MPKGYVFLSWKTAVGYLISILIGHIIIRPIMEKIFRTANLTQHLESHWMAGWVGVFERAIYTTAILISGKEIIAGWLALKAIAELKSPGRELIGYYTFLMGNGMSLVFGIGGGLIALYVL